MQEGGTWTPKETGLLTPGSRPWLGHITRITVIHSQAYTYQQRFANHLTIHSLYAQLLIRDIMSTRAIPLSLVLAMTCSVGRYILPVSHDVIDGKLYTEDLIALFRCRPAPVLCLPFENLDGFSG